MSRHYIQTFTGKQFDFKDPNVESIDIKDIAHALSMICRFNGHCTRFYSVAEHSIRVSRLLSREHALWGLLHDAHEAYVGNMVMPLKVYLRESAAPMMTSWHHLESWCREAIRDRFNLPGSMPPEVKEADMVMLATERRDLMVPSEVEWYPLPEPLLLIENLIEGRFWDDRMETVLAPGDVELLFHTEFERLTQGVPRVGE